MVTIWDGATTENKIDKSLASIADWKTSDEEGDIGNDTNYSSDFMAYPAGDRNYNGYFTDIDEESHWWSSIEIGSNADYRFLSITYPFIPWSKWSNKN